MTAEARVVRDLRGWSERACRAFCEVFEDNIAVGPPYPWVAVVEVACGHCGGGVWDADWQGCAEDEHVVHADCRMTPCPDE